MTKGTNFLKQEKKKGKSLNSTCPTTHVRKTIVLCYSSYKLHQIPILIAVFSPNPAGTIIALSLLTVLKLKNNLQSSHRHHTTHNRPSTTEHLLLLYPNFMFALNCSLCYVNNLTGYTSIKTRVSNSPQCSDGSQERPASQQTKQPNKNQKTNQISHN